MGVALGFFDVVYSWVIALYGIRTFFILVFVYGRGKGIVGRIYRTEKII